MVLQSAEGRVARKLFLTTQSKRTEFVNDLLLKNTENPGCLAGILLHFLQQERKWWSYCIPAQNNQKPEWTQGFALNTGVYSIHHCNTEEKKLRSTA